MEDDSGFLHSRMLTQYALDLHRTDPHATDFKHVISASGVPEIAAFILVVLVPGSDPMTLDCVLSLFVLVPIAGTSGVGLHEQIANLSLGNALVVVVHDPGLEPGNDLPTGAGPHRSWNIGNHHVQCLGGPDCIQDFYSEALFEAMENSGW